MALIKKTELKQMQLPSIDWKITELKKDLMKLNSQRAVGSAIEDPGKIKEIKRTIAKMLTLKNQPVKTKLEEANKKV